jgi:hypothetical protein
MTSYADNSGMLDDELEPTQITLNLSTNEWIKITSEGFWVRGVKVPQDEKEAVTVYNAFKEYLTWANMTRQ